MSDVPFQSLHRDAFGKLVLVALDGDTHVGVTPVRAHPLSAPDEGLSLVGSHGHEVAWVERLADLPDAARALIELELRQREFHPQMRKLLAVSTFSTPSQWTVETDVGSFDFLLRSEEDIRRLEEGRLMITTSHGVQLFVPDRWSLDRHSKRLLERFL